MVILLPQLLAYLHPHPRLRLRLRSLSHPARCSCICLPDHVQILHRCNFILSAPAYVHIHSSIGPGSIISPVEPIAENLLLRKWISSLSLAAPVLIALYNVSEKIKCLPTHRIFSPAIISNCILVLAGNRSLVEIVIIIYLLFVIYPMIDKNAESN